MGVADVPAVEIEVGEQEYDQRCREDRFAGSAPDSFRAGAEVEDLAPEAEVDADVDQHGPAERGGCGEHHRALHDEQDGQEQREQAGDADDDAVVKREGVDLVLVGVGVPQIDLRQLVGAQFGDEGDDGAGIERDAENIGGGRVLPFRPVAGRRRDVDDARDAEVGPQHARARHAIARHDDQAVDLFVAGICNGDDGPVAAALARTHADAAHDAVGAGSGRNLDEVAVGFLDFSGVGKIDGRSIDADVHGVERARACAGGEQPEHYRHGSCETQQTQTQPLQPEIPKP